MTSSTDIDSPLGSSCLKMAGLVLRFHAGEATLAELEQILEHVPGCETCRGMFDGVGRELGAITTSWTDSLAAYDPARMLEAAGSVADPPRTRVPLAIKVLAGAAWETARTVASGLMSLAAAEPSPAFRAPGAGPSVCRGAAGEFSVTMARSASGSIEILVEGARGGVVRLEAGGRALCEAPLDGEGKARFSEPPPEPFDTVRVLAPR